MEKHIQVQYRSDSDFNIWVNISYQYKYEDGTLHIYLGGGTGYSIQMEEWAVDKVLHYIQKANLNEKGVNLLFELLGGYSRFSDFNNI